MESNTKFTGIDNSQFSVNLSPKSALKYLPHNQFELEDDYSMFFANEPNAFLEGQFPQVPQAGTYFNQFFSSETFSILTDGTPLYQKALAAFPSSAGQGSNWRPLSYNKVVTRGVIVKIENPSSDLECTFNIPQPERFNFQTNGISAGSNLLFESGELALTGWRSLGIWFYEDLNDYEDSYGWFLFPFGTTITVSAGTVDITEVQRGQFLWCLDYSMQFAPWERGISLWDGTYKMGKNIYSPVSVVGGMDEFSNEIFTPKMFYTFLRLPTQKVLGVGSVSPVSPSEGLYWAWPNSENCLFSSYMPSETFSRYGQFEDSETNPYKGQQVPLIFNGKRFVPNNGQNIGLTGDFYTVVGL